MTGSATGTVAGAAYAPAWMGTPTMAGPAMTRLQRPRAQRLVAGVCAGLALQYGWDLTWVRVLTVLITIFSSGAGLIAYIVFWLVMPEQPWMLPAPVGTGTGSQAGSQGTPQAPPTV